MTCADWIDLGQLLATLGIGWVGFKYMEKQNIILSRQNTILEHQNEVMKNQADLNDRLIQREDQERDRADTMDALEKLYLGSPDGAEERLEIYTRLMQKRLSLKQLIYYGNQLFPGNNGEIQGMIRGLEDLYVRQQMVHGLQLLREHAKASPPPSDHTPPGDSL